MKSLTALLVALCIAAAPSVSHATGFWFFGGFTPFKQDFNKKAHSHKHHRFCGHKDWKDHKGPKKGHTPPKKDPKPPVTDVPEISTGGAGLALSLMGGLMLVARERRRKNQA